METEPGARYVHKLGDNFVYNGKGPEGRLCLTNGDFPAYDSPERAKLVKPQDGKGTTSKWRVKSGGRLGYVVGEDAREGGCSK
jgi:hypothetical protein